MVYTAGPMSGIPQFNFPAFDEAAARLRRLGYEVVSPAELDSPESRAAALASEDGDPAEYASTTGETWGDLLARDVKIVADEVDVVAVLPGWQSSRGARLETYVARLCGKPVVEYPTLDPVDARVLDAAHLGLALEVTPTAGEERVVNAETGGAKGRKPQRMELVPWRSVAAISEVYAFGAAKYDEHNWLRGYAWSLSFGALMRHLAAFWAGEDDDPESGLSHLAHAGFHVLALLTFTERFASLDDRPPRP